MSLDQLHAISALDGRYHNQTSGMGDVVSEGALINYRIQVEASWLLYMASPKLKILRLEGAGEAFLKDIINGAIPDSAASEVKELEKKTNHDVKAVEYWLRAELLKRGASNHVLAHIHFACTSEDINNLAYAMMLRDVRDKILKPSVEELVTKIKSLALATAKSRMVSRTHGQTASPTTMGKELAVFAYRVNRQLELLGRRPILGKFNGAVGNFNAHIAAYPDMDWRNISKDFIEDRLSLTWNPLTTQIESHDGFVEFMQNLQLLNSVLIDFSRDIWGYISLGYFAQKIHKDEVGSSTMPHKVNPIYFENGEGNLGVANSLLGHFAEKLPISRWQRDLSDSTVLRVTGTAIGHAVLAYKSLVRGLDRLEINESKMQDDLDDAWEVLAEPIQTVMRRFGVVDAYERLKQATRGHSEISRDIIHALIDNCAEIPSGEKNRMKQWTPASYVGLAPELAREFSEK